MDPLNLPKDPLPLTRAGLLEAQIQVLRNIGAPVTSGLARSRLPVNIDEMPQAWVPYRNTRLLIQDMAHSQGVPDIGFFPEVSDFNILNEAYRRLILSAPTLKMALHRMIKASRLQNKAAILWLETRGDVVRSCVTFLWPHELGHAISETLTLELMRSVIRAYTGKSFVASRVLLQSRKADLLFDPERAYAGIPVLTGQPCGAIEFPRKWLSLSSGYADGQDHITFQETTTPTLSSTLEMCLQAYLSGGHPSIQLASDLVGCSSRTLQRKLMNEGSNYRLVVQQARFSAARKMLRDKDMPLSAISAALGYSELSAFYRAFAGWTGQTPAAYRSLCLSDRLV